MLLTNHWPRVAALAALHADPNTLGLALSSRFRHSLSIKNTTTPTAAAPPRRAASNRADWQPLLFAFSSVVTFFHQSEHPTILWHSMLAAERLWRVIAIVLVASQCVASGSAAIPSDWAAAQARGDLLYSASVDGALLPEIGNGFIATLVGSDTIYAAGVFNGAAQSAPSHRARIPPFDTTLVGVADADEAVEHPLGDVTTPVTMDPAPQDISGGHHSATGTSNAPDAFGSGAALDMAHAVFMTRSMLPSGLNVEERRYAHLMRASILVHEIELANTGSAAPITVQLASAQVGAKSTDFDFNSTTMRLSYPTRARVSAGATARHRVPGEPSVPVSLLEVGGSQQVFIRNGSIVETETATSERVVVATVSSVATGSVTVPPTKTVTLTFLTAVCSSLNATGDVNAPLTCAHNAFDDAVAAAEAGTLLSSHEAAWASRLSAGRLEVAGDVVLAAVINASLYALRSSSRADWPYSLSPGGLANDGYNGHTFWDAATWMYPALLLTEPATAHSILEYRYNRMAPSRAKAASRGYKGTMYAWESAFTGVECCAGPWGVYENHITGDIAFAVQQYWRLTHDKAWLASVGFPLLQGAADFWASRATFDASLGKFTIYNVMPPDEYHYPVNSSVYTNVIANMSLQFAISAARELGHEPEAAWLNVSSNMFVLFDSSKQYHPEFAGYAGDEVKQADVILLGFPLQFDMPPAVRANDLEFYASVTAAHGPAMTWSMFAIGWMDLRNASMAAQLFEKGYQTVQPPFNVWRETIGGGCTPFLTGAGGFLQSVIFGHAGIRLMDDALVVQPPPEPPVNASAVAVHGVAYLGTSLRVDTAADDITISLLARPAGTPALAVTSASGGDTRLLNKVGDAATLPRAPARVVAAQ